MVYKTVTFEHEHDVEGDDVELLNFKEAMLVFGMNFVLLFSVNDRMND